MEAEEEGRYVSREKGADEICGWMVVASAQGEGRADGVIPVLVSAREGHGVIPVVEDVAVEDIGEDFAQEIALRKVLDNAPRERKRCGYAQCGAPEKDSSKDQLHGSLYGHAEEGVEYTPAYHAQHCDHSLPRCIVERQARVAEGFEVLGRGG